MVSNPNLREPDNIVIVLILMKKTIILLKKLVNSIFKS